MLERVLAEQGSGGRTMIFPSREVVPKPWGSEDRFAQTDLYAGKILVMTGGCATSVQYHVEKDETLRVLVGVVVAQEFGVDGKTLVDQVGLGPGDAVRFPRGTVHRIVAVTEAKILEASTRHDDADTRRVERDGRTLGGPLPQEELDVLIEFVKVEEKREEMRRLI